MLNFLRGLFGLQRDEAPVTKLTERQALAIAQSADIPAAYKNNLRLAIPESKAGKVLWTVTSLSRGSNDLVVVDDETAQIVEIRHVGVR